MDLRKKITLSGKEGETQVQDMEVVYRQHAQTVFKYLMLLTHEADLAEELTQETFLLRRYEALTGLMKAARSRRGCVPLQKISIFPI